MVIDYLRYTLVCLCLFFFSSRRRHTRCALVTGVQTCALPICWSRRNPMKPEQGMAPLRARLRSARNAARRAPTRATAIERDLGTRFTVDTIRALIRRYPKRRFIWLMGADNLQQFHHWRQWREIAQIGRAHV